MKNYIIKDNWNIIEEGFEPSLNRISESIFSLGNGRMGQRANFEETYTGQHTLQGNYIAGVYYPDKTRVGWWKNGYPEYFAKVLNAANWMGLHILINGEILDLNIVQVSDFKRVLNMKEGYLLRTFKAKFNNGNEIQVQSQRFFSIVDDEAACFAYEITPLNFEAQLQISSFTDAGIKNQDANYDERFWELKSQKTEANQTSVLLETKKTTFQVATATHTEVVLAKPTQFQTYQNGDKYGCTFETSLPQNQKITLHKYVLNASSENYEKTTLLAVAEQKLADFVAKGFQENLKTQVQAWQQKWQHNDIIIEGDVAAQQAIRFNIFQLHQTYTGADDRLNIGPKGFTGEKYGGSTYWDTEAYCIPFYLGTAQAQVAKNLLLYRYKQLDKAIENAQKLGFKDGAALYPMVTMNGEECHNEWEITFEEIHRNGAIAFAIFNYIRYTNDEKYLVSNGLEVLIAIAKFWQQRVNWSEARQKYVMLGVTGPNEYENNINNNWYTNTIAVWCMKYALEAIEKVKKMDLNAYQTLVSKINFDETQTSKAWKAIIENMYLPEDEGLGIFLQQDGFLDKEQILVKDLPDSERPIHQKWSWDRILRSNFIKQADVLQGIYFFEQDYDIETIRRNFDFYESRTVHESSLSPCIHSIMAAKLGDQGRAYAFYLRTARLDLDDYNNDTEDGLHITSMAGTWLSVVEGFAGMRVVNQQLVFRPFIPQEWENYTFNVNFRHHILNISVNAEKIMVSNHNSDEISIQLYENQYLIKGNTTLIIKYLK